MTTSYLAFGARRATGLSQRAFARLLDVHPTTVARWESGARDPGGLTASLLLLIRAEPEVCVRLLRQRTGATC